MAALKKLAQPSRNKDHENDRFTAYGMSYAADLRELNQTNPKTCILAKKKLMDEIVVKAFLGELDSCTQVVNVTNVNADEWDTSN